MLVRHFQEKDLQSICDIYNYYIENTVITFEETPLSPEQMLARINAYLESYPWLVCEIDDQVVGYAYASKWKERSAYKHTAEATVYVKQGLSRKGYGKALYQALIELLMKTECHRLLGCIALPNESSAALHEYFGFQKAAHFNEVGRKFNRWIDVGYWSKNLK